MFIQNVVLLCLSMIVLGAVLGYSTPYLRRRFLSKWLADVPLDFLPEKLRPQKAQVIEPNADIPLLESEMQTGLASNSAPEMSQQHKKDIEAANHFSQLATQRKLELDDYRADVKGHFVEVAKLLNDDYEDANDMNQALINQIGTGAEQLVGARSMKDTLDHQPLKTVVEPQELGAKELESNSQLIEGEEWIPVEAEEEIDAFFEENKSIQSVELRQEAAVSPIAEEVSDLGSLDMDIPSSYDTTEHTENAENIGQNTAQLSSRENRFQEIADGIEGKSAMGLSGVKNWFKGVAGAASSALPKRNLNTTTEAFATEVDSVTKPKDAPHYDEAGVLVDTCVLDSQWDLDSVEIGSVDNYKLNDNFVQQFAEQPAPESMGQSAPESIPNLELYSESYVEGTVKTTSVDKDLRSDFVYQDAQVENAEAPQKKENPYGEAVKYLGLQQGLATGLTTGSTTGSTVDLTSQAADLQNTPVLEPQLKIDTGIITDKITSTQHHTSEMLDPYDRITDAVLKESSSLNMNDEKKIVHELFYVRGHQSNISGRAMSNINPGIRKDN